MSEVFRYVPHPPPQIEGSLPIHYERELRSLQRTLFAMARALEDALARIEALET